ncbi:MAG: tetratricopeptide repeat protein, partial [Deltaproteobacteria bacterium]
GARYYSWLISSFVAALCAVKSKETAFTLPFMVLLCEFAFFKSSARTIAIRLVPFVFVVLLIPLDAYLWNYGQEAGLIETIGRSTIETDGLTRYQYFLTQFRVIATYLRLLILPINQNIDYDYAISTGIFGPNVLCSLALHLSLLTAAFWLIIRNRKEEGNGLLTVAGFGIVWFYLALSVESSIIPIRDVIFEHRLYLPSFGMILAVLSLAAYFTELTGKRAWFIQAVTFGILLCAILAYSVATFNRNELWKSGLKLWEDAVIHSPSKARAYHGVAYFKAVKGMNSEAIPHFKKALELLDFPLIRLNLAISYRNLGRFDEARMELEKVVKTAPGTPDAVNLLALTYMKLGRDEDALMVLTDPATKNDKDPDILNTTGTVYAQMEDFEHAEEYFEKAHALKPENVEIVNNLARLYEKFGHIDKGIRAAKRVTELDSKSHVAANLLGSFCLKKGEWAKAKVQFEKAVALAPDNPKYKKNLEICNTLLINSIVNSKASKPLSTGLIR